MYFVNVSENNEDFIVIFPDEKEIKRFTDCGKTPPKPHKSKIILDKFGKECFVLPNWRSPHESNKYFMFSNHIVDAITEIRDGYADRIETNFNGFDGLIFNTRPTQFRLYRYIDREFGDKLKNESINGWKNVTFCYSIVIYNPNSLNGKRFVSVDYDYWDGISEILHFDTYQEAQETVDMIVNKSKEFASLICGVDDKEITYDEYVSMVSEYPNIIRYGSESGYIFDYNNRESTNSDTDSYVIQIIQDVK